MRSLHGWATAALLLIAVSALTSLVYAFVPLVEVWQARQVASTGGNGAAAVVTLTRLTVFLLLVLGHLGAWTSVLVWLYRAYANVRVFPGVRPAFPVGLAIGGWFVPFANLVLPPLVVRDLARASEPAGRTRRLVWLWWAAYVLAGIGVVAGSGYADDPELSGIRAALAGGDSVDTGVAGRVFGRQVNGVLPAMALYLFAGVLLMVLIHRITAAQYDRIDLLRRAPVQPVPAEPVPGPWPAADATWHPVDAPAVPATGPDATIGT